MKINEKLMKNQLKDLPSPRHRYGLRNAYVWGLYTLDTINCNNVIVIAIDWPSPDSQVRTTLKFEMQENKKDVCWKQ